MYKIQQELQVKGLGERSHGSLKNGFTSSEDLGIFLDLILKEEFWEPLGPLYKQYEVNIFLPIFIVGDQKWQKRVSGVSFWIFFISGN